jgi:hypothetical protein
MTNPILRRARPDILKMKQYSSARLLHKKPAGTIYLDANECYFEPFVGAENLSRYPDQQPQKLVFVGSMMYRLAIWQLHVVLTRPLIV